LSDGLARHTQENPKNGCANRPTDKRSFEGDLVTKRNLEVYESIDDLGKTFGLSKAEIALIREKKKAIAKLKADGPMIQMWRCCVTTNLIKFAQVS